ncbi:MAG: hypothetical protein OXI04_01415 [Bacteroidota bacterium]|nr:hypothetical protein [Bacteroidota bacterium]MXW82224.1 hypothetical protein [Rhodothermaceae bacterium]MYI44096.1 hypothetical protein [Rhodothermaceae bacterium]
MSDLTRVTVAPGLQPSNSFPDRGKVKEEANEKEYRDPQAHLASCVDTCEHPAALPVNDNDPSNGDYSQRGGVRPQLNRPEPV